MPVSALLRRAIVRPLKMLCFCPLVTGLSFYIAIVYGFTYLLFSTFSFVFEGQYHYTPSNLGLAYLGLAGGMLISLTIASFVSDRTYVRLTKKHKKEKPEYMLILPVALATTNLDYRYRLESLIYGSISIPIGLFIYGWTAEKEVHSAVPISATAFVGFGVMFTFVCLPADTVIRAPY